LGQVPVPVKWHAPIDLKLPAGYVPPKLRPSRGGEAFDWGPINRGIARLNQVIRIILKSADGNMTAERAYQIILSRKTNMLPSNVYNRSMSQARFRVYYHKIRQEMNIPDGRQFKTNFIKKNKDEWSAGEIAIYLETTENCVLQTISKINRGLIK